MTPLSYPAGDAASGDDHLTGRQPIDSYEISMQQISQRSCLMACPATTVWGYGAVRAAERRLLLHHAPSLTIEAGGTGPSA